jgi:hypothetical protein
MNDTTEQKEKALAKAIDTVSKLPKKMIQDRDSLSTAQRKHKIAKAKMARKSRKINRK